eukprot:747125-Hanusia_phi.AAC.2
MTSRGILTRRAARTAARARLLPRDSPASLATTAQVEVSCSLFAASQSLSGGSSDKIPCSAEPGSFCPGGPPCSSIPLLLTVDLQRDRRTRQESPVRSAPGVREECPTPDLARPKWARTVLRAAPTQQALPAQLASSGESPWRQPRQASLPGAPFPPSLSPPSSRTWQAPAGKYCPASSPSPEGIQCPVGFFCTGGNAGKEEEEEGEQEQEREGAGAGGRSRRRLSRRISGLTDDADKLPCTCAPGNFCDASSSSPQGQKCPAGHVCLGGESEPLPPRPPLSPGQGQTTVDPCPAGMRGAAPAGVLMTYVQATSAMEDPPCRQPARWRGGGDFSRCPIPLL